MTRLMSSSGRMLTLLSLAGSEASYVGMPVSMTRPARSTPPTMAAEALQTVPPLLAGATAISPVFIASYYGAKMNVARDNLARSIEKHKRAHDACLRGEGCVADYEASEAAFLCAQRQYDEICGKPLAQMMGSATRELWLAANEETCRDVSVAVPAATGEHAEVNPFVRLGAAALELASVLLIVGTGVIMLQLMQCAPSDHRTRALSPLLPLPPRLLAAPSLCRSFSAPSLFPAP